MCVGIKKHDEKEIELTYRPNDAKCASFGLFPVAVTVQHAPCHVLGRLLWRSVCTKNILGPRYKRGCQIHELE